MDDEGLSVEQFCRRRVEPMGEESDHVHIVALTDALQVLGQSEYAQRYHSLVYLAPMKHGSTGKATWVKMFPAAIQCSS